MKELWDPFTKYLIGQNPNMLITEGRFGEETPSKNPTYIWAAMSSTIKFMYIILFYSHN